MRICATPLLIRRLYGLHGLTLVLALLAQYRDGGGGASINIWTIMALGGLRLADREGLKSLF